MLHMVILSHTAESCPGRPENKNIVACVNKTNDLIKERGIKLSGSWADPPSHVNYMVLDAPNTHAIQQLLMDSGLSAHTMAEVHAVISVG